MGYDFTELALLIRAAAAGTNYSFANCHEETKMRALESAKLITVHGNSPTKEISITMAGLRIANGLAADFLKAKQETRP